MTFKSSLMFAKRLIFPRVDKKSSARRSFFGALLCIGLSLVPLIVVLSITNGMIDGMTERIIGLSSSHIQAYVARGISYTKSAENFINYSKAFKEKLDFLKAKGYEATAATIRFILAWKGKDDENETAIILPDLCLNKKM